MKIDLKFNQVFFSLIVFFQMALSAQAEILDLEVPATNRSQSRATARQQMFQQAIEEVSLEHIQDMIGAAKVAKHRSLIDAKILRQSGKYVLSIKGGSLEKKGTGYAMPVYVRFSPDNLKALLLEHGLLYDLDGPPRLLPLVSWVDRVNSVRYSWWDPPQSMDVSQLKSWAIQANSRLKDELRKQNFFGLSPVKRHFERRVPEAYKVDRPRTEDYIFLGTFFESSIVLKGDVKLSLKPQQAEVFLVDVRWVVLHSGNGRILGEVVRHYETEVGPFKQVVAKKLEEVVPRLAEDLTQLLHEAWARGTFGSSLVQLTLRGNLNSRQLDRLKGAILKSVSAIKGMRERRFEPGLITFEMDTSSTTRQIAQAMEKKKWSGYKVEVSDVGKASLALQVKAW